MKDDPTKNTQWRLDGTVFTDKEDRQTYRELRRKPVNYLLQFDPNITQDEYETIQTKMRELEQKYLT